MLAGSCKHRQAITCSFTPERAHSTGQPPTAQCDNTSVKRDHTVSIL